ncbi:hypothetical protein JVT61DRAFT_15416 [Boletus reticuloceps]|uniref:Uncharacterized protein n=1 Tax=Boletus reticuloceps TaxID=495285 RepID=A0A8I3ABQ0_9AGAM|nr:hypothetical protein JVT61DRAFT_15416 [Boletus reticuloceps]
MAGSSMVTLVTNATAASNQDLNGQVSPTDLPSQSQPEVASILDETESAKLDDPVTSSLTLDRCFAVPEMPGVSLTSSTFALSISDFNPQFGATSISDAVPAKGTPSAIRALKFHRHPAALFHSVATPFRNQNPSLDSPRALHRLDMVLDSEVDGDAKEREHEEAQLVLAVVRAQRNVYNLEHQLISARVEESELLGNLYRFRMQEGLRVPILDIRLIHRDISKNGVPLHNRHKHRRTSSSLHESFTAGTYPPIVNSISLIYSPIAASGFPDSEA